MALVYGGKVSWTSSASWQAPFACTYADVHVIGGGGAGFPDNTGPGSNGDGGGGGGGGVGLTSVTMTPLAFYSITVGSGGAAGPPESRSASPGGTSSFSGPGVYVFGNGGARGRDGDANAAGGTGTSASGGQGQNDNGERRGGSAGGCGNPNQGRTIDIDSISCVWGGGYGRGGRGSKNGGSATDGSQGAVAIKYYFEQPSGTIAINNSIMTEGESATVTWTTSYADAASITNVGVVSAVGIGATVVTPGVGTTCYQLTATGPGGSATAGPVCVTVYPVPTIDSFYLSDYNPLSGDSVTLYWSTSGSVATSRKVSDVASGLNSTSVASSGSYTFTAGTGGVYNVTLTVENGAGKKVTSSPLQFTIRDETPNDFEWDDNLNNSALQRLNIESNTITINGFGPTQYPSSKLPIKSNYPVQVMVNGDGIWRDVEQM